MDIDTYQRVAADTAIYDSALALMYPALGLSGEQGEVAEVVKKHFRDNPDAVARMKNGDPIDLPDDVRDRLAKELGDVLWYVAAIARDAGLYLSTIANGNLNKLQSRKERGVLRGSGDYR